MKTSKILLVGAGPGDPELITLKAVNALQKADVVLYDALANKQLLNHCSPDCERIFVGKRSGVKRYSQLEINEIMVSKALRKGTVVRLKGGDPTVFGRCYEELEYCEAHGLEVEIIPGISSSISIPAINKMPLTQRGVSSSFWVLTATDLRERLSRDLDLALQSSATLVILMGLSKLAKIAELLKANGKSDLPIAVIQNGSLEEQKSVMGTVNDIVERVAEAGIKTPALIVAGRSIVRQPLTHLFPLTTNNFEHESALSHLHKTG